MSHPREKISIGLPKGRFKKNSINLIEKICEIKVKKDRRLKFTGKNIDCYLLKSQDIPELVQSGKIDIGICPEEWDLEHMAEHSRALHKWARLPWIKVKLALIADESVDLDKVERSAIEVCSSYPNYTKQMAGELKKIIKVKKIVVKRMAGSIEATIPWMYPFGVECIETSGTIKTNSLKVVKILKDNLVMGVFSQNYLKQYEKIVAKIKSYETN